MKKKLQGKVKAVAGSRIRKLFNIARQEADKRPALAKRYVNLARQLARKSQTQIPKELKRSFCKKCELPFTARTRTRTSKGFLVKECVCGAKRKFKVLR